MQEENWNAPMKDDSDSENSGDPENNFDKAKAVKRNKMPCYSKKDHVGWILKIATWVSKKGDYRCFNEKSFQGVL